MHQTFFYIPKDIAGISIFGVGWLLGLVILAAIGTTIYQVVHYKRNGQGEDSQDSSTLQKELLGFFPFWIFLIVVVVWVLPFIMKDHEGLPIRGYGVMLLLAVIAGTLMSIWRGRRIGLSADQVISLMFWLFVPGILGARVFFIIEYWHTFQDATIGETISNMLSITEGGLVVYGSIIGGLLGIVTFVIKHKLRLLKVLDMLAPSLMLGIAIGRIGCFLNGCCFGGVCDMPWAVTFPRDSPPYVSQIERGQILGVRFSPDPQGPPILLEVVPDSPAYVGDFRWRDDVIRGLRSGDEIVSINNRPIENNSQLQKALLRVHTIGAEDTLTVQKKDGSKVELSLVWTERSLPVHPTQIYSSLNAFILCLFLLAVSPFLRREGALFALMMTIYPITRFMLEIIRTDETAVFGTGLSISQNVSIVFLVGIAGLWLYIMTRKAPTT